MGYYSGSGITASGNKTTGTIGTYCFPNGYHVVWQKTSSVVTKYSGVSLDTAESVDASVTMYSVGDYYQVSSTSGGITYYKEVTFPNARGTRISTNFTRIGDSNLFVLTKTSDTCWAKIDNNGWQS